MAPNTRKALQITPLKLREATHSLLVGVFIQDMRYINFTYAYAWDQPFVDFKSIETSQNEEKEKIDLKH